MLLWTLVSMLVGWAGTTLDDLHYGRPRTFQVDAYVDHNERPGHPTHFIVVNLNRHIDIIELEGGDPAHAHIYVGPTLTGPDANLTPATLRFVSIAGQRYPSMQLLVGSSQVLYLTTQAGALCPLLRTLPPPMRSKDAFLSPWRLANDLYVGEEKEYICYTEASDVPFFASSGDDE